MERDVLIQLWMANGFLSPPEDSSVRMEDIGEKYYRYLLSYSLFQEESNIDFWGRVRVACKMHDLIHDFAQSISETAIVDKESVNKLPSSIRHLNIVCGGEIVPRMLRDAAPKLRTLLFSDNDAPNGVQSDFKRLRVLNVSKASDAKQLSKCFGDSKSLRYLDISSTEMEEFPKFIKKLYNLQTLRLMYCRSLQMPAEGLRDLINLSHIYFSHEVLMPANLGSLTNLQTLNKFYVGKTKGREIKELGSLSKLRGKLAIYKLELVEGKAEAESGRLHEKALDELSLYWGWDRSEDSNNDEGVLEGLLPHSSLQRLYIKNFGGTCLSSWMLKSGDNRFQLNSLVVLEFESCKKLKSIPIMEGFSSLKELSIESCEELYDGAFTFQSLQKLSIQNCPNVESFSFSGLTSLEELEIEECGVVNITGDGLSSCTHLRVLKLMRCKKLKNVPNLHGLSSLREVVIAECGELACLPNGWSSCTALEVLSIYHCANLIYVPEELKELHSLKSLSISSCSGLRSLHSGLPSCTSLEKLVIYDCDNLVSIPVELKELRSLVELDITDCPKLGSFLEDILGSLTRLKTLSLGPFCEDLEEFVGLSSIHHLHSSLEKLRLWGREKLAELPQQIQHLNALRTLYIWNFEGMEALPDWLAENLPSLQSLEIVECPKLNKTLPSAQLIKRLSKLNLLHISFPDWPELEEKIRQEKQSGQSRKS